MRASLTRLRHLYMSRDATVARRRELLTGAAGILAVVALLLVVGALYVVPFGKRSYTALLPEAQTVKTGDDVRLAGVPVGKVTALELTDDNVRMTFTVSSDVFVGAETTLDIRMLTIVGGHYVALEPAGTTSLGATAIPADRVRLPYNLLRAFQDAVEPIRAIDGTLLGADLDALSATLADSPDGVRSAVTGLGRFVDALQRQRTELAESISIAEELLGAVAQSRGSLGRLVEKVSLLETILTDKRAEARHAVGLLDSVVNRIGALEPAWRETLLPIAARIAELVPALDALGAQLQPLIDTVHGLGQQLNGYLPESGRVGLDASGATVCIPVAGRTC